jgi:hypothetical protein
VGAIEAGAAAERGALAAELASTAYA